MKHFAIFATLVSSLLLCPPPAAADIVSDWNIAALNAIRAERTSPPVAARALAILHVSIFDAINGIDRSCNHYFVPSAVPASASIEAAASAASNGASDRAAGIGHPRSRMMAVLLPRPERNRRPLERR